jgi:hypothetical protein
MVIFKIWIFWECPPPMGFTYHKAQGKIYLEQVGIISLPISTRGIDGYKVPSTSTTNLLQVLYI